MRILVISDIHGNASALPAVIGAEQHVDHTIFLGDTLLSGPQANETEALLQSMNIDISIPGNHDDPLFDYSKFAHYPIEWIALNQWIIDHLDSGARELLQGFKNAGCHSIADTKMFLHHGEMGKHIPAAIPGAPDESFAALDGDSDCPLILFGHTHVQFSQKIGNKTSINPGSVGQPRCGKLYACYGVFEDGLYYPRQVTYDPAPWLKALEKIAALDSFSVFRQWLKDGLLSGYGFGEREPWTYLTAQGFN